MLDEDFCIFLEYKICEAFEKSTRETVKGFWCDGVLLPNTAVDYSNKSVNDMRQVVMTVYIGPTGQDVFELTLKFGRKALSRYSRGLDISVCLPNPESDDWWEVDIKRRTIWIQLD